MSEKKSKIELKQEARRAKKGPPIVSEDQEVDGIAQPMGRESKMDGLAAMVQDEGVSRR